MSPPKELFVTLDGRRKVTTHVGAHRITADQPLANGGDDSAPTPYELFLASIAACAGTYVQHFCSLRNLDATGVVIREWPRYDEKGALLAVELALELPPTFPPRYAEALLRVVEQCSVKRAIAAHPEFLVRIAARHEAPALAVVGH